MNRITAIIEKSDSGYFSIYTGLSYALDFTPEHTLTMAAQSDMLFAKEIQERWSGGAGVEYLWQRMMAVRAGYHHYAGMHLGTVGMGWSGSFMSLDVAYLFGKLATFNQLRVGVSFAF